MFLSFTVWDRDANAIFPSSTPDETTVDCARPFGVTVIAMPV
jgi:hypothetical protein